MILLDTNTISEMVRAVRHPAVDLYLRTIAAEEIFTSVICEMEILYGLRRLPSGRRRMELEKRIEAFFGGPLEDHVLPFDRACADSCGHIRTDREASGRPITIADAMIAATASVHSATLVTRNVRDFADCGIDLVDPWLSPQP